MGRNRSNSASCKQPHTVVSEVKTLVIIIQHVYKELCLWTDKDDIPVISAKTVRGKGGLAKSETVGSYSFFFLLFCSLEPYCHNSKTSLEQGYFTYTHLCCGHLDPGLVEAMSAAEMFDL